MGWWSERVVPRLVDASLSQPPVDDLRALVCASLHGRTLEVGFGSGLGLPHLPAAVSALDVVEPSDLAWSRSAGRRDRARVPVERIGLDGGRVAAADGGYDSALVAFALCTVPDALAVADEMRRVVRPGGHLAFLEHGLSPDPGVARWQRRLDGTQQRLFGGCHLTRDPVATLEATGWEVVDCERHYLAPGPGRPWTWLSRGRALRRPGG